MTKKKYKIKCKECKKIFEVYPCRKNIAKYCSRLCQNRFQNKYLGAKFKKGNKLGKFKRSKETREKIE